MAANATLLVVHHTTSPALEAMLEATLRGTSAEGIAGVDVVVRAALAASAADVANAHGFLLGTPANIGYMSGALKHFFDLVYYPCRVETAGAPYGVYVHGNEDLTGALRSVAAVAAGLGWQRAHADVTTLGTPGKDDLQACFDLGGTLAARLMT